MMVMNYDSSIYDNVNNSYSLVMMVIVIIVIRISIMTVTVNSGDYYYSIDYEDNKNNDGV